MLKLTLIKQCLFPFNRLRHGKRTNVWNCHLHSNSFIQIKTPVFLYEYFYALSRNASHSTSRGHGKRRALTGQSGSLRKLWLGSRTIRVSLEVIYNLWLISCKWRKLELWLVFLYLFICLFKKCIFKIYYIVGGGRM